jgi:hypothetical protein
MSTVFHDEFIAKLLKFKNEFSFMSFNPEFLRTLYPEWEPKTSPFLPIIEIFVAIAIFLLVPYILTKFIEHGFVVSETREIDGTEIDDWFAFRKTYQTPK